MRKAEELRARVDAAAREAEAAAAASAQRYQAELRKAATAAVPRLVQTCLKAAEAVAAEGGTFVRVHDYSWVAQSVSLVVAKRLREEGFTVKVRKYARLAGRIDGEGNSLSDSQPYAVWELSW